MKTYENFAELVGNTPLLRLNNFFSGANVYAKLEYFNPAGSVKDRVALNIIETAEKEGKLNKNSVIIEATSGNTGIGLVAVAAAKGYKCIIVMPENMSNERKQIMSAFGTQLVLTEASLGMSGANKKAEELFKTTKNAFMANQFSNPANPEAHFKTTAPEIYEALDGKVDVFVAGIGTGGTISGIAKYLKSKNNNIKIIGVEPYSSPLITKGVSAPHKIQGIGANFIPETLDISLIDEVVTVTNDDALNTAREFVKSEGVFVGISSGAALSAVKEIIKREGLRGKNIIVLLPDGGEKYLSSGI